MNDILTEVAKSFRLIRPKTNKGDIKPFITYTKQLTGTAFLNLGTSEEEIFNGLMNLFGPNGIVRSFKRYYYPKKLIWTSTLYVKPRVTEILDEKAKVQTVMKNIPHYGGIVRNRIQDNRNLIIDFSDLMEKVIPTDRSIMQRSTVLKYIENIYPELICYILFKNNKHDKNNDIETSEESFTENLLSNTSVISMGKVPIGIEQAGFDKFIISFPYTLKANRFVTINYIKGKIPLQRNMKINPDLIYQLSMLQFIYKCYEVYCGGSSSSEFVNEVARHNVTFHIYGETGIGFAINFKELKTQMKFSPDRFIKMFVNRLNLLTMCNTGVLKASDIDEVDKEEVNIEIDGYYKKNSDLMEGENDSKLKTALKKAFKPILKNDSVMKNILDAKKKNKEETIKSPDDIDLRHKVDISHKISIGKIDRNGVNKLEDIENMFSKKTTTVVSDNKSEATDVTLTDDDFDEILNQNDGETEEVNEEENIVETSNDTLYEHDDDDETGFKEEGEFDDMYEFEETENESPEEELEYVEIKPKGSGPIKLDKVKNTEVYRTAAEQKRIDKLKEKYKSVDLNGKKIEDIVGQSSDIEIDKSYDSIGNKPKSKDKSVSQMNLMDFQKSYIKNNYQSDIINAVRSLSVNKANPLYITGANVADNSDQFTEKLTYSFTLEDENKKKHEIKFDVPKISENGRIRINGSNYYIKKQLIRKPIVKIGPDKVYVTTELNSFQVMRTGIALNRGSEIMRKLLSGYLTEKENIHIERGNCELDNTPYLTTLEYDTLAKNYFFIKINDEKSKYGEHIEIYFSQKAIRERIKTFQIRTGFKDDIIPSNILPVAINYTSKTLIYIDMNRNNSINSTIISIINDALKEPEMIEYIKSIKAPKKRLSTKIEIQSFTVPLIAFLNYLFGWDRVSSYFKENEIEFSDKLIKNTNKMSIKFYDGYLYYNQYPINGALLINGLTEIDTENYKYEDLNNQGLYINYTYNRFKTRNVVKGWITAKENMLDLKTLQILEALKLPTDFLEIFLYCNDLLVDNQCAVDCDIGNYRIRSNEIISECVFKALNDEYTKYRKRSGKINRLSVPQNVVIGKIQDLEILETYDSLSPIAELREMGITTFKGPGGTKLEQAFTLQKRAYDKSYYGVFGISTVDNSSAGVSKELTMNCNIQNTLGFVGPIDESNKDIANLSPISEAIVPFVTDYDDPSRVAFTSIQTKHVGGMTNSSLPIVRTGVEKNIQYQTSDVFAKLAKTDGVISSIDEVEKKIYVTYKDGTKETVDYKNLMIKNSDAFNQAEYTCFVKVGQKVKSKDILVGDTRFFKRDPISNEIIYTQCINGLFGISEGSYTEDDSSLLCSTFANQMVMDFTKRKQISLKANDTLIEYKKVGDKVELGDPLIIFDESGTFEEDQSDEEDSMYKMLFDSLDKDVLSKMIHQTPKAPISGVISDIKVYWTVPVSNLSKTLAKFVREYIAKINKEIVEEEAFTNKPSEKRICVNVTKIQNSNGRLNGCEVDPDGGVVIEYYISNADTMSTGDKVSLNSALKTVTSQIIPRDLEPYTESGKRIDGIFSLVSVDARMINSVWYTGWLGKIIYDFSKRFATGFLNEIGEPLPKSDRIIEKK